MNWEFDKDFLPRAPALSTAPSVFTTSPPPSLSGFLVWTLNSARSLFRVQVNDNHVINTHSHTHTHAHKKLFKSVQLAPDPKTGEEARARRS